MPVSLRQSCSLARYACYQYLDITVQEDLDGDCPHRTYEEKRVKHLMNKLEEAFEQEQESEQLIGRQKVILRKADLCLATLQSEEDPKDEIIDVYEGCRLLKLFIEDQDLPSVRPRIAHFTDAGPGVGISNFEVCFRDAELSRLEDSDYRIRIHRGRGDSEQNEAELPILHQVMLLLMGLLSTGSTIGNLKI